MDTAMYIPQLTMGQYDGEPIRVWREHAGVLVSIEGLLTGVDSIGVLLRVPAWGKTVFLPWHIINYVELDGAVSQTWEGEAERQPATTEDDDTPRTSRDGKLDLSY